ncbi:MAG: hypothetical protein U5R31_13130 [Acidimicrobiia bacterium]|nr:hypothetical protein [Acidimicrobiia bacterium]
MTTEDPTESSPYDDEGERRDLSSGAPPKVIAIGAPALIAGVIAVALGIPWWIVLIVLGVLASTVSRP